MSELISVIVPVFNAVDYIDRCLLSLSNQTDENFEVIIIDDGSNDGTAIKLDDWSKKEDNFIVTHVANSGVSSARNLGLKLCKGQYICFVDSDDFVNSHYLELMRNKMMQYNVDIVLCSNEVYYDNSVFRIIDHVRSGFFDRNTLFDLFSLRNTCCYSAPWGKLFKREVWNNIYFNVQKKFSEDAEALLYVYANVNSCYGLDKVLYEYVHSLNSETRTNYRVFDALDTDYLKIRYLLSNSFDGRKINNSITSFIRNLYFAGSRNTISQKYESLFSSIYNIRSRFPFNVRLDLYLYRNKKGIYKYIYNLQNILLKLNRLTRVRFVLSKEKV